MTEDDGYWEGREGMYRELRAEIEHLTAENERLTAPIGMQDVRLVAGEGKLSAAHTLQAVNVILKQRRERAAP